MTIIKRGDAVALFVPKYGEVEAEVIDTYKDLYLVDVDECSIRFNYEGDTVVVHGIDVSTVKLKGGKQ